MPGKLSELEKLVVCRLLVDPDFTRTDAWNTLHPETPDKNAESRAGSWLCTQRVQQYYIVQKQNIIRAAGRIQSNAMKQGREGIQGAYRTNETQSNLANVDFTDREQFLQFANQQANLIQDEKQRLDYLKILSDLMRYKEPESTSDNEIQRFYTPFKCLECKLYQAAKKGLK